MRKREPVSIILPTYNRAAKIGKAIESVLRQTYEAFELLIIDDGSADDTEEVVRAYADSRIVYERMPENGGQSRARNRGMQMASYDYLAFEDSDDLWRPEKLEKQMDALAHADDKVGMVYHKLRYDLGEGRYFLLPDETIAREKKSGDIYAQLLWDNLIGMPTLLIKKECVESVGYMDCGALRITSSRFGSQRSTMRFFWMKCIWTRSSARRESPEIPCSICSRAVRYSGNIKPITSQREPLTTA